MPRKPSTPPQHTPGGTFSQRLLAWYDGHARALPWRAPPGERADPYRVWLSEIMLQQTTVRAVTPRFQEFVERWPTVEALAAAERDAVLDAWAGLGYYARARNMHACAQAVVAEHCGRFPEAAAELERLPGIGPYTAAAIAAIAFDRPAAAVDGNVERVIARLFAIATPLPAAKTEIRTHAERLVPHHRPGDFAQAMMDLGATVCTPSRPNCLLCPVRAGCAAHAAGAQERYPVKAAKAARPTRRAVVFWAEADERVLLRRRPASGLLGGMLEIPSSPWQPRETFDQTAALAHAPLEADWTLTGRSVRHTFTHFHLELDLAIARRARRLHVEDGDWMAFEALDRLPSVMRKAARLARSQ